MERKLTAAERSGVETMVKSELEQIREKEKSRHEARLLMTNGGMTVVLPLPDEILCHEMTTRGYQMVASAYPSTAFRKMGWEGEQCEGRIAEVHLFRDERGEKFLIHIIREFKSEDGLKTEKTEWVFRRSDISDLEMFLQEVNVPIDVRDAESFIYF